MLFPSFTLGWFAIAGAVCALGPVIIHLLNRQRYRTVQWAAMDFLREAIQRNRRILQIRDIVLLVLRTAAVLFFGFALAQPFFSATSGNFDQKQPLHAILLIDNSLSMGYEALDGDLLSKAKGRAKEFLDELPVGSKVTVIPVCGSIDPINPDPYDTQEMALEAIDRIQLVDRRAEVTPAINQAKDAALSAPQLAKRIVFFGDQQAANWQDVKGEDLASENLPLQVVDVSAHDWENSWIENIIVQDDLADIETPTTIIVEVAHRGESPRRDVAVRLMIGDKVLDDKTVTLEPGQGVRQVEFQHVFNDLTKLPEADRPVFVTLKASLQADRLPDDDERYLSVPVVAALPVVFIDQYGDEEDAAKNKLGETRHLRQLLAPKISHQDTAKALVHVRHIRLEEMSQEILADARLVVIAGIHDPGSSANVALLRDYVRQGGSLIIAAGADFDPPSWNAVGWEEGNGILPLPLLGSMTGEIPEIAGERLKTFFLSFESLAGEDLFQLPNVPENDLRDLYAEAIFFKAADVDLSGEALAKAKDALRKRLETELGFLTEADARREQFSEAEAKGTLSEAQRNEWRADDDRRKELRPTWLTWAQSPELTSVAEQEDSLPADPAERERILTKLVDTQRLRTLARFESESGPAFMVEGRIDRGRVVFVSSGLQSSWNILPKTNAMVIFDRLLREMVVQTLPQRNYGAEERVSIPVPSADRELQLSLIRPGSEGAPEALDVGFIGQDRRGVTVSHLYKRGVYQIRDMRDEDPATTSGHQPFEVTLVVNGDPAESELDPLSRPQFDQLAEGTKVSWVDDGEQISLAGTALYGQGWWWWLVVAVLTFLFIEMAILAWPAWRDSQQPAAGTTVPARGAAA